MEFKNDRADSMPPDKFLFVTVGSTDFDPLVKAADSAVSQFDGLRGVMQIGHGEYEPKNLPFFRYATSLAPYYKKASLVIAHGGLGTTMEVLQRGIPLVSVSNDDRYDSHQDDLLEAMEADGYLTWCRELSLLDESVEEALSKRFKAYKTPDCSIHLEIRRYLNGQGSQNCKQIVNRSEQENPIR